MGIEYVSVDCEYTLRVYIWMNSPKKGGKNSWVIQHIHKCSYCCSSKAGGTVNNYTNAKDKCSYGLFGLWQLWNQSCYRTCLLLTSPNEPVYYVRMVHTHNLTLIYRPIIQDENSTHSSDVSTINKKAILIIPSRNEDQV